MAQFTLHVPSHKNKIEGERLNLVCLLFAALIARPNHVQSAEATNGMVVSGNPKLAEFLTMLLRAKKFPALLDQLQYAMFADVERGSAGVLAASVDGVDYSFRLHQKVAPPQFKWNFEPINFSVS